MSVRALPFPKAVQGEPHGDVSRVLSWRGGVSGGATASGDQRIDLGGLVGRDSRGGGTRADSRGSVSAVKIFSGDDGEDRLSGMCYRACVAIQFRAGRQFKRLRKKQTILSFRAKRGISLRLIPMKRNTDSSLRSE